MFCVPVNLLCASRGRQHRLICHVFGLFICYLLPAERHTHTHTRKLHLDVGGFFCSLLYPGT